MVFAIVKAERIGGDYRLQCIICIGKRCQHILRAGLSGFGEIIEIDPDGKLVRKILDPDGLFPPFTTGSPMGLAVDSNGSIYYADLGLYWKEGWFNIGTSKNCKVRQITFDKEGNPNPPKTLLEGLGFPDGVAVFPGQLPLSISNNFLTESP